MSFRREHQDGANAVCWSEAMTSFLYRCSSVMVVLVVRRWRSRSFTGFLKGPTGRIGGPLDCFRPLFVGVVTASLIQTANEVFLSVGRCGALFSFIGRVVCW